EYVAAPAPGVEVRLQLAVFVQLFRDDFAKPVLVGQGIKIVVRIQGVKPVVLCDGGMEPDAGHPVSVLGQSDPVTDGGKLALGIKLSESRFAEPLKQHFLVESKGKQHLASQHCGHEGAPLGPVSPQHRQTERKSGINDERTEKVEAG